MLTWRLPAARSAGSKLTVVRKPGNVPENVSPWYLPANASDEPGAATRAYLRSAAQPAPRPVLALLAAAISNPAALESLNQRYTTWQRRLDHDGIPPHVATLVRCAIDGLWLAETFDLAAPNPATRSRMLAELEKLID